MATKAAKKIVVMTSKINKVIEDLQYTREFFHMDEAMYVMLLKVETDLTKVLELNEVD